MLNEIVALLKPGVGKKISDISNVLNTTRSKVSITLYKNPSVFYKEDSGCWILINPIEVDSESKTINPRKNKYVGIGIGNESTIDRLKIELNTKSKQKISDLARNLGISRSLIKKTLSSNEACFYENDFHEWTVISTLDVMYDYDADAAIRPSHVIKNMLRNDFSGKNISAKKAIIEASLDRNLLVLAPPGTGKTHALIERLIFSITNADHTTDAVNLLVLSFTRAAVGEIRERIRRAVADGAPNNLRYVQVKTFDAYATWLLNDGDYDITGKDYDSRIKFLTKELKKNSLKQNTGRINSCRYLFVDEIQDLVSVRADMVFELIKRIVSNEGAITLLGDPHQSLNNYQIEGGQTDSLGFLEKVKNYLSESLEQFELEESYRYDTPEMKVLAADAKNILDSSVQTAGDKFKALLKLIPRISKAELVAKFVKKEVDALLCRSNSEVYQWFNWHQKQGGTCIVNMGSHGKPWPAWIGSTLIHYQSDVISRDQFLVRAKKNSDLKFSQNENDIDRLLVNEKLLRGSTLNLKEIAFRLKFLAPVFKGDLSDNGLVISTVHKAKGLEYNNVVVLEPVINKKKGITDEEVRVLYVAITRAKRSISLLPKKATPFSGWISEKKGGHLGYSEDGIKYLQVTGLQDFDLETLFINEKGGVDTINLENYLLAYQEESNYSIRPESYNAENDHNYALYLNSSLGPVRLCAVGEKMKISLDAMAWGNKYGEDGALLDIGEGCNYQTIAHPMQSPILARHIGPAGIMVFPLIQGFYTLSRAAGE